MEKTSMSKVTRFGVKFVGYGAWIIGLKRELEIDYAYLDFVSGCATLIAEGGDVTVNNLADLRQVVADLPKLVRGLRRGESTAEINLPCGANKLFIAANADINQVIRQLAKRHSEAEPVMKQAKEVGLKIKRTPYSQYIEELRETGICRVEAHGFGMFEHGKLFFHADRREALVRSTELGNTFTVEQIDEWAKGSIN
jgi:hypothetical protein